MEYALVDTNTKPRTNSEFTERDILLLQVRQGRNRKPIKEPNTEL